jgi:hypothetical protein
MPSDHKKEVIKALRSRYGKAWAVKIIPVGIELQRDVSSELTQHVFFNFVRDDTLGLRIQPGAAVRFAAVNAARDAILPHHQHAVDSMTGFVFLNNLIDTAHRQNGGWLFEVNKSLQPDLDIFLSFVDAALKESAFFESLQTLNDYIAAVEGRRWAFITGALPYLYALIAVGQVAKAKALAAEHRAHVVQIAIEKGFVQKESDTRPYDEILQMPESKFLIK